MALRCQSFIKKKVIKTSMASNQSNKHSLVEVNICDHLQLIEISHSVSVVTPGAT